MEKAEKFNYISPRKIQLAIAIAGVLLFIPFLGNVHLFDWDENNFAEAAREMIVTGNYLQVQIDFVPFYEKPPFFFWLQAISMQIFGINEFAARFPNAIAGIVTLLVLFAIGRRLHNNTFGLLWVIAYAGSVLPFFYFKSGIIDPVFNLFIFLGLYFFIKNSLEEHSSAHWSWNAGLAGAFIGMAILTKGPVGLLIPFLAIAVFILLRKFRFFFGIKELVILGSMVFLVAFSWFGIDWMVNGPDFLVAFTIRQWELLTTPDAGHGQPFYYHFLVLLIGCFPASILSIAGHWKSNSDNYSQRLFHTWMIILFWVVLILFSMVTTKIVHYSSLAYFPLTFLGAFYFYRLLKGEVKWNGFVGAGLIAIALIYLSAFILVPVIGLRPGILTPLINDPFAVASLSADVRWGISDFFVPLIFASGVLVAIIFVVKKHYLQAVLSFFITTIVILQVVLPFWMPKIEKYSQNPAITYYQQVKEKNAYLHVLGFKSYGYLFYSAKMPYENQSPEFQQLLESKKISGNHSGNWPDHREFEILRRWWLLRGQIDKPAYFVTKTTDAAGLMESFPLEKANQKGGFVLLVRYPENYAREKLSD